jgi:hypothetical protein
MDKSKVYFNESVKSLQMADHMTYVTYPLINEKKILLRILELLYKSINYSVKTIIILNNEKKHIENSDLIKYLEKTGLLDKKQIIGVKDIFMIHEKHKKSAIEFTKNNKIIIMSDNLDIDSIDIQRIKEYLLITKEFIEKVNGLMNK